MPETGPARTVDLDLGIIHRQVGDFWGHDAHEECGSHGIIWVKRSLFIVPEPEPQKIDGRREAIVSGCEHAQESAPEMRKDLARGYGDVGIETANSDRAMDSRKPDIPSRVIVPLVIGQLGIGSCECGAGRCLRSSC